MWSALQGPAALLQQLAQGAAPQQAHASAAQHPGGRQQQQVQGVATFGAVPSQAPVLAWHVANGGEPHESQQEQAQAQQQPQLAHRAWPMAVDDGVLPDVERAAAVGGAAEQSAAAGAELAGTIHADAGAAIAAVTALVEEQAQQEAQQAAADNARLPVVMVADDESSDSEGSLPEIDMGDPDAVFQAAAAASEESDLDSSSADEDSSSSASGA
jgi:hypothetical protein